MTKLPETTPVGDTVTDPEVAMAQGEAQPHTEQAPEPSIPAALPGLLASARHVVVLSAEADGPLPASGPDARTGGDLASFEAFRRDPTRVWAWYEQRREYAARAMPGALHTSLVLLENRVRNFTLITESVDGLHQRAGNDQVVELRGSLHDTICASEGKRITSWRAAPGAVPRCPDCGDFLRPDVVWPGEIFSAAALARAQQATRRCELLFVIGPLSTGAPMATLRTMALEHGATIVHVGPDVENRSLPPVMRIKGDPAQVLMALARVG
jgi:NAD-dependent deacetylase